MGTINDVSYFCLTLVAMEGVGHPSLDTWPPFSRETSGNSRERHSRQFVLGHARELPHGYLERMMVRTSRASALGCPACQPGGTARALLAPPALLPPLACSRRAAFAQQYTGGIVPDMLEGPMMVPRLNINGSSSVFDGPHL